MGLPEQNSASKIVFAAALMMCYFVGHSLPRDSLRPRFLVLSTSTFEYFPSMVLSTYNVNLGTELRLRNRWAIYSNFGILRTAESGGGLITIEAKETQGYKLQLEGKRYLNRHRIIEPAILVFWPHILQYESRKLENTGYYVAANTSLQVTRSVRSQTVLDYFDNNPFPNSAHYKDIVYVVERRAYGLNLRIGYQCVKACGLTIDYAVGLGAQFISSTTSNPLRDETVWPAMQTEFPWGKLFDRGAGLYPKLAYQLRLGWQF